jgi:hypothetical protein
MNELRRRAYLDAMGFDVWSVKPPAPACNRLVLQPGDGDTLLVCAQPENTAGRFAGDLARVLDGQVVWAWPEAEGGVANPTLEEAVQQHLFTRVVLFGKELGRRIVKGDIPLVVGSARILVTENLPDLADSGRSKLEFWKQLFETGAVKSDTRT